MWQRGLNALNQTEFLSKDMLCTTVDDCRSAVAGYILRRVQIVLGGLISIEDCRGALYTPRLAYTATGDNITDGDSEWQRPHRRPRADARLTHSAGRSGRVSGLAAKLFSHMRSRRASSHLSTKFRSLVLLTNLMSGMQRLWLIEILERVLGRGSKFDSAKSL
jgi:hypothetical protein